jgi:hypothetical protein
MLDAATYVEDAYRPSPRCPHCGTSTRFARSLPNFGAQTPLQAFECPLCDLSVTRRVDDDIVAAVA